METITIDKDIRVFYVNATSFPEGVMEAHNKIHALAPASQGRRFYGLSRPERGVISYKAAAEELTSGEAEQLNLDTITIKKGRYISETLHDFMKNIPAIGSTFQQMLSSEDIAPDGYCVEYYLNDKDVQLMVRLKD